MAKAIPGCEVRGRTALGREMGKRLVVAMGISIWSFKDTLVGKVFAVFMAFVLAMGLSSTSAFAVGDVDDGTPNPASTDGAIEGADGQGDLAATPAPQSDEEVDGSAIEPTATAVAPTSIEVTARLGLDADALTQDATLDLTRGTLISDLAPEIDGYRYDRATYGSMTVTRIEYDEYQGVLYVTNDDNAVSGTKLETATELELHYVPTNTEFTVDYTFAGDAGNGLTEETFPGTVLLPKRVVKGETLEFVIEPQKGYTVEVTADGKLVSSDADGKYFVETSASDPANDLNVTINVTEQKQHKLYLYKSSNTTLVNAQGNKTSGQDSTTASVNYQASSPLAFTLEGNMNNTGDNKTLNKLAFSLTGEEGTFVSADIPANVGDEAVTRDVHGLTITVKREANENRYFNGKTISSKIYTVTVANESGKGNVHGDIYVSTNYKSDTSSEVWGKNFEGVETPIAYNEKKGASELNVAQFKHLDRDGGYGTYIYIKPLPGYSTNPDDITVTVTIDGKSYPCELRSTAGLKASNTIGKEGKRSNIKEDTGVNSSNNAPLLHLHSSR